jgi:hypothetical protein
MQFGCSWFSCSHPSLAAAHARPCHGSCNQCLVLCMRMQVKQSCTAVITTIHARVCEGLSTIQERALADMATTTRASQWVVAAQPATCN